MSGKIMNKVNAWYNIVKLNVTVFKRAYASTVRMHESTMYTPIYANNVPVFANTDVMRVLAQDFITDDDKIFNAGANAIDGHIYVPDSWSLWDVNMRNFVLAHELGHITHKHIFVKPSTNNITIGFKRMKYNKERRDTSMVNNAVDARELEADLYAVSLIGTENSIIGMMAFIEAHKNTEQVVELEMRLEAIRKAPFVPNKELLIVDTSKQAMKAAVVALTDNPMFETSEELV